ncbi:MAG: hypothetical protein FWB79_06410 [Treponema sp.]|nr:hypothetical protein [Treponema sp.]
MGSSNDWRDVKYDETFEAEMRGLERRRAADPDLTVADIEAKLRHLRILDGADQGGRGGLQDAALAATIAAHEVFISQWTAESGKPE